MKKTVVRRVARAAEPMIGNSAGAGVDVSGLYIDMLCERFKDRGIRTVGGTKKKSAALSGTLSKPLNQPPMVSLSWVPV